MLIKKNPFAVLKNSRGNMYLIEDRNVFQCNGITHFIWESIQGEVTSEFLLSKILENFEVTNEEAEDDLNSVLRQLKDNKLVL